MHFVCRLTDHQYAALLYAARRGLQAEETDPPDNLALDMSRNERLAAIREAISALHDAEVVSPARAYLKR